MTLTECMQKAIFIGTNKSMGFIKGHIYRIAIENNKKYGYQIMADYDFSNNCDCNLYCPYSSETSIRRNWRILEENEDKTKN